MDREYILFLVDDNIFVADFLVNESMQSLASRPRAIGFSYRLGRNTTYCYSLNQAQAVPPLTLLPGFEQAGIYSFNWVGASCDFGYPLEVSSSLYRSADLMPVLSTLHFAHPNSLEGLLAQQAGRFSNSHPELLCYQESVTFCNPINKVQNVAPDNRAGETVSHSSDDLSAVFERGGRVDVRAYSGFKPNACHQEVELQVSFPAGAQFSQASASPRPTQIFVEQQSEPVVHVSESPLISVVVPCYKQAHLLTDALGSLISQTYTNWECFIVNDGSPDDTSAVARRFMQEHPHHRFQLLEKENEGLAEARNTGIKEARGEWILPLDSDDKFAPTMMEKVMGAALADSSVNIVSANLQCFGAKNDILEVFPFSQAQLMYGNMFPYASLYRRELWVRFGGYIPIIPFGAEDYNFWVTCSSHLKPARVPEPLFLYRKHVGASMVDAVISHQFEVDACLHSCHPGLYPAERLLMDHQVLGVMQDDTRAAIDKTIARFPQYSQPYLWRGLHNEQRGSWRQALRDFTAAAKLAADNDWQPWFRLTLLNAEKEFVNEAASAARETIERCPSFPARPQLEKLISMAA
jgi:glycosyltransferase involved in cell wall biosynthesis